MSKALSSLSGTCGGLVCLFLFCCCSRAAGYSLVISVVLLGPSGGSLGTCGAVLLDGPFTTQLGRAARFYWRGDFPIKPGRTSAPIIKPARTSRWR